MPVIGGKKEKKEKRFEVVHRESVRAMQGATIIRDKQTGVQYLFIAEGYAGGLTPLIDMEGRPIR